MAERGLRHRAGWTLGDQALSSGTNAALSIAVARSVGAAEFGAFSVAFVVFALLIGISRATVTDPLIVRFSAAGPGQLARAGGEATGAALALGAVTGACCAAAGAVLGGPVGAALLGLALGLPGLLLQDAWRQVFFAAGRPREAALNDAVWAVGLAIGVGGLVALDGASVFALVLAWGGAATVAAVVGTAQSGYLPHPERWAAWLRAHRELTGRLAAAYSVNMAAVHLTMVLVAAIGGLAAVGAIRAAQVLLGPLQVLFPGLAAFALPVLSRRADAGARGLLAPALALSSGAAAVAAGWLVVLLLLPGEAGVALLGESWSRARAVLPAVGATTVLVGAAVGATLTLKALASGGRILAAAVVQALAVLILGVLGALADGARGAAWGMACAHLAGVGLQWLFVTRPGAGVARGATS